MPRESYYQDVGNPIRHTLLPKRQLSMAIALRSAPALKQASLIVKVIAGILAIEVLDAVAASKLAPEGALLLRSIALFAFSLAFFAVFATGNKNRWLAITFAVFGIGSAAVTILGRLDGGDGMVEGFHAAFCLACFTWLFAQHWTELCITSPLDRASAAQLRRAWKPASLVMAGVPILAAVLWRIASPMIAFVFLLSMCSMPALLSVARSRRLRSLVGSAVLRSWMTYNMQRLSRPGTFVSPVGDVWARNSALVATSYIISTCARDFSPLPVGTGLLMATTLPAMLLQPILAEAEEHRTEGITPQRWPTVVRTLRQSPNPIERDSYYMGQVLADGTPLIVPRKVFGEHAHFLGDSGAGKTSRGITPFIEQTILFGDASLIVIDLKADTLELLATMVRAAETLRQERSIDLPLKYITTEDHLSTFAFNPQAQPFWNRLTSYRKTDLMTASTGTQYGVDYGEAWYSAVNAGVLNHTYKLYPEIDTFQALADRCGHVIGNAKDEDLHKEIRKNAAHVHEVAKRLAAFAPLNASARNGFPNDVVQMAVDLADIFCRPQLLYFHLPSMLSPGLSPAIARFASSFCIACAKNATRNVPVYLVIDEFQRMVARDFEYLLQLARSMGIGIVLANQSMTDLRTSTADLVNTVETNCRYRQWFAISSIDDQERLSRSSGETIEYFTSRGTTKNSRGETSTTQTVTEHVMPRLSINDIALASDHPDHSIVKINRGDDYAQFSGLPFVCESNYHITAEEYARRKQMQWPHREPGTFIPDEWTSNNQSSTSRPLGRPNKPSGPVITTEVIGSEQDTQLDELFEKLADEHKKPRRKRGARR